MKLLVLVLIAVHWKTRISRRTKKYASYPLLELAFFLVSESAHISFDISWPKSFSHKEHFLRRRNVAQLDAKRLCTFYVRVLKNSSLEILGNPIFFLLDSTACSLPERAQSRDTEETVVEIECKPWEEIRKTEGQAYACI